VVIAELMERGSGSLVARLLGAGLGGILGLFVGLGRAVWRPGQPLPDREPVPASAPTREAGPVSPQLWDPWLDGGRDAAWAAPEVEVERGPTPVAEDPPVAVEGSPDSTAERAPVRPRVIAPDSCPGGRGIACDSSTSLPATCLPSTQPLRRVTS
jgi:hypothetical protein